MSEQAASAKKMTQLEIHGGLNKVAVAWVFGSIWVEIAYGAPIVGLFITLGAPTFLIGLLGVMPALATLVQPLGSYAVERATRRKRTFLALGSIHRLLWIPLAIVPLVLDAPEQAIVICLLILGVSYLLGSFAGPFWVTWVGDLVPERIRGVYFGRRAMLGRISGALAVLLAGLYLAKAPPLSKLAIVFVAASLAGFFDIFLHKWVPETPVHRRLGPPVNILQMLFEPAKDRSFRAFMVFSAILSSGVAVTGAYFNLYLLRELSLSYLQIALFMTVLQALTFILFSELFGLCADQFGNKPVLIVCSIAVTFMPLLLVFCGPQSYFLLALVGIIGGASWAGVNLATLNMQLGLAPADKRHSYIGAFALLTGASTAIGTLLGVGIATATQNLSLALPGMTIQGLHFVLLASVLIRAASVPLLSLVQEPDVKPVGYVVRALRTLNPFRRLYNIYAYQYSSSEVRRAHAIHAIGMSGSTLGVEKVISALDDSSRLVREEAARALGQMGAPEGVEPLVKRLEDPESSIQAASASSLGKLKDRRGVPPLVHSLSSNDRDVRGAAASALGEIGDQSAVQPLMDLMKRETDSFVFASGAEALGRLGEAQAVLIILPALEKVTHPIVRKQLAVAVGNLLGQQGELYRLLSAEERIEGLGASRLVSDIRGALSRWRESGPRNKAQKALQTLVEASADGDVNAILDAVDQAASAMIEKRFPTELPWHQNIQRIWDQDEKLGCQLVFLDYLLKHRERVSSEEVLLAIYALRCLCRQLLPEGRKASGQ
jgi:MFS family permease